MTEDELLVNTVVWNRSMDPHTAAAVDMLHQHDYWLKEGRLLKFTVQGSDGMAYLDWAMLRKALDGGEFTKASSTQVAVLDFAVALGEDRYKLSEMGTTNGVLLVEALAWSVGVDVEL